MPKQKQCRRPIVPYVKGFKPPSEKMKIFATLANKEKFEEIHDAFKPHPCLHEPISQCTSIDDWLAQYKENGQSYSHFLRECPWLSTRPRKSISMKFEPNGVTICQKYPDGKVYIVPLGDFTQCSKQNVCIPNVSAITEYCKIFLGMPTVTLPVISLKAVSGKINWIEEKSVNGKCNRRVINTLLHSRYHKTTNRYQLGIGNVLAKLRKILPSDAICLIALTMYDLFEDDSDLFVAGMAAGNHRVAVFSLLRYDPNLEFSGGDWFDIRESRRHCEAERMALVLLRSCKLVVHEICHLLGIDHCIYFMCCMNGSGHLEEDFRQPMYLCPVDLRKLHTLVGFNVLQRYQKLLEFFQKYHMQIEADWTAKRLKSLEVSSL